MTDGATADPGAPVARPAAAQGLLVGAALTVVVGAALAWSARSGALSLLVAVAVVQGVLAVAWVFGMRLPGRLGGLVIAAFAAAAADTATSVWPHSRLGTLLAVLALAVPVLFVHQLLRGVARVRVVASLGGIALLVIAEVSLAALVQLRHEFPGRTVVFGVVVVAAGAALVAHLADLALPVPRFDDAVPRALPGVVAAAAAGAALGDLTLRHAAAFGGGRGLYVGAALGALVGLLGVAAAFVEHGAPPTASRFARRVRPAVGVLLPLCVLAPVAFLLCLAVRS